jgi:hypothetical protein
MLHGSIIGGASEEHNECGSAALLLGVNLVHFF